MNTIKHRILDNIETLINKQTQKGIKTYGHTLDDCPIDKYDWQQMIIEELIDALQYQQKQMDKLKHDKERYRKRIKILQSRWDC